MQELHPANMHAPSLPAASERPKSVQRIPTKDSKPSSPSPQKGAMVPPGTCMDDKLGADACIASILEAFGDSSDDVLGQSAHMGEQANPGDDSCQTDVASSHGDSNIGSRIAPRNSAQSVQVLACKKS